MRRVAFLGIDLQRDFTSPDGAVPVPGAGKVVEGAARLTRHALQREIPLILTVDSHDDEDPSFDAFPPHNVIGTAGHDLDPALGVQSWQEIPQTALAAVTVQPGEPVVVVAGNHRRGLFQNLNTDAVIKSADAEEWVVFGLPTELGVRAAVTGLCARGITTILVSDAVAHLDDQVAGSQIAALAGLGCRFLTVDKVLERYA